MNDPVYNQLREQGWRRKLTAAQEVELRAWLAAHPEARADWEAEAGLNAVLDRLPDAPVPTNFTSRVLQAVRRETAAKSPGCGWNRKWWRSLLPRAAFAAVVLGAGLLAYHQHQEAKAMEVAQDVAAVWSTASLPSPEIMKDFDSISQLNPAPPADEQLLALMSK